MQIARVRGETKAGVGGRHGDQRVPATYWVLLGATGCCALLQGATRCYRVLLCATGCYWLLISATGCYRVLLGATGCYCVLLRWTDSYFEEEGGLIQMKGLELGKSESNINCNIKFNKNKWKI